MYYNKSYAFCQSDFIMFSPVIGLARHAIMKAMKLRYETGIATMTQFLVLGMLNLLYAIYSSIHSCLNHDQCASNSMLSIVYFVLLGVWFGFIAALGYAAQDKRSKRLSQVLIMAEALVALVALFNLKHYADYFGLVISVIDLGLAVWVGVLAFRLMRSGGGRITRTTSQRPRQRKKPVTED
ncbi:MAG: hypothetical protein JWO41_90 [Candidatus Saccharibacteria bacterium]|nr:hypothetical protein [Candidatus Saccharibacteria bacterium]